MLYKCILVCSLLFSGGLPAFSLSSKEISKEVNDVSDHAIPTENKYANHEDITKKLSREQQSKIVNLFTHCNAKYTVAKNQVSYVVRVVVVVDATGRIKTLDFDIDTKSKAKDDPDYRVFVEHVRSVVLNPKCSMLPIPSNMLGQRNTIRFVFRP